MVLCLVQFVDVLGVTSALTALPVITTALGGTPAATTVTATAYACAFGGLLIAGARLGDRYGHHRILQGAVLAFAAASLAGSLAPNLWLVAAARAGQGAAAAVCVPAALHLLITTSRAGGFTDSALAAWSACGAAAGASGYLVGGLLTQAAGWRSVFWINVPIAVALLVAVRFQVHPAPTTTSPAPSDSTTRAGARPRINATGAVLLLVAVSAIVGAASLLEQASTRRGALLLLGAGVLVAGVFMEQQQRSTEPLVPAPTLRLPSLRIGSLVSGVNTATTSAVGVLATFLLQQHLGASALVAGLLLVPFSLAVVAGSASTKTLARSLSVQRRALAGLAGIGVGCVVLAVTAGTWWGVVAGVSITGVGLGVASWRQPPSAPTSRPSWSEPRRGW